MIIAYNTTNSRKAADGHVWLVTELQSVELPDPMPLTGEGIEGMEDDERLDTGSLLHVLENGGSEWVLGEDFTWYRQTEDAEPVPRYPIYKDAEEAYNAERPANWPAMPETPPETVTILRAMTKDDPVLTEYDPDFGNSGAVGWAVSAAFAFSTSTHGTEQRFGHLNDKGEIGWSAWEDTGFGDNQGFFAFHKPYTGEGIKYEFHQFRPKSGGTFGNVYAWDYGNFTDTSVVEITLNIPHSTSFSLSAQNLKPAFPNLQFASLLDMGAANHSHNIYHGIFFAHHSKLKVIREFNPGAAKSLVGAFEGCENLIDTGLKSLGSVTKIGYFCKGAKGLPKIPAVDYAEIQSAEFAFEGCESLIDVPELMLPNATFTRNLFAACTRLSHVGQIMFSETSSPTNYTHDRLFDGDVSLIRVDAIITPAELITSLFLGSGVVSIGRIDAPNAEGLDSVFSGCLNLRAVPSLRLKDDATISLGQAFYNCASLTDISALDGRRYKNLSNAFQGCAALEHFGGFSDISFEGNFYNAFSKCSALKDIDGMRYATPTNLSYAFSACTSLQDASGLSDADLTQCTNFARLFYNCNALTTIPALDTSRATTLGYLFYNCTSMKKSPPLDLRNVDASSSSSSNGLYSTFGGTINLETVGRLTFGGTKIKYTNSMGLVGTSSNKKKIAHITLDPSVTNWSGVNISLVYDSIEHDAMIELFNSLPTITTAHNLTITGNPCADGGLNSDEIAIATNKGWNIVGATNILDPPPIEDGGDEPEPPPPEDEGV